VALKSRTKRNAALSVNYTAAARNPPGGLVVLASGNRLPFKNEPPARLEARRGVLEMIGARGRTRSNTGIAPVPAAVNTSLALSSLSTGARHEVAAARCHQGAVALHQGRGVGRGTSSQVATEIEHPTLEGMSRQVGGRRPDTEGAPAEKVQRCTRRCTKRCTRCTRCTPTKRRTDKKRREGHADPNELGA
jgi:hypothetical protein